MVRDAGDAAEDVSAAETVRPYSRSVGACLAAIPLPVVAAIQTHGISAVSVHGWVFGAVMVTCVSLALAAVTLAAAPSMGRRFVTAAIAAMAAVGFEAMIDSPALTLACALIAAAVMARLWIPSLGSAHWIARPYGGARARGASLASIGALIWLVLGVPQPGPIERVALGCSLVIALALVLAWIFDHRARHQRRAAILLSALAMEVVLFVWSWGDERVMLGALALLPGVAIVAIPWPPSPATEMLPWWDPITGHPERMVVVTFGAISVIGAFLLVLPLSANVGRNVAAVDALFTAVSAACVTGLVVLDTGSVFSGFGQLVIVLLIQIGGLGIMTFSTAGLKLLGGKMSLRHESAAADLLSLGDRGQLFALARTVLIFTAITEAIGVALLLPAFMAAGEDLAGALWRAVFTSISAFCNAGFTLSSDSLVPYREQPLILHVIGVLIILGGLSPVAALAIPALLAKKRPKPIAVQIKIVVVTTAVLLVSGFVLFLAMEWSSSLASLSWPDRLHNAWFQSVTVRTVGFNSITLTEMRSATVAFMILWMFIGASPGGTGGGIKTTTLAVLVLVVIAAVRHQTRLVVFSRRIPERTIYKAAAIMTVAAAGVFLGLLAMQLTQDMPDSLALFEVVSALSTTGLSLGATNLLDGVGKGIIITSMFVGRVGSLTFFMFLSKRADSTSGVGRPEEDVAVG